MTTLKNTSLKYFLPILYVIFILVFLLKNAYSITLEVIRDPNDDVSIIFLKGNIDDGDSSLFIQKTTSIKGNAIVFLDSNGGLVVEALKIGRLIRNNGWATASAGKQQCASACALIWLGGNNRYFHETSKIGLHSSYIIIDGKPTKSIIGNIKIAAYLYALGLPEDAIEFATLASPTEMYWLTFESLTKLKIRSFDINKNPIYDDNFNSNLNENRKIGDVAYKHALIRYKDSGFSTLQSEIEDCYKSAIVSKNINEIGFCYIFHWVSANIQSAGVKLFNFPKDEYYSSKNVKLKLDQGFYAAGIGFQERKSYIIFWHTLIDEASKRNKL
jgi:hypothetical protein